MAIAKQQPSQAAQSIVEIQDIQDGVIIMKNGSLKQILMVTGINFDLKSESEQNLIIDAYQNFINSLDFSVQLLVHTRQLNIEGYLDKLKEVQAKEPSELLKNQIEDYIEFIRSFVQQNAIMDKTFFVVVPYNPTQVSQAAAKGGVFSFLKKPGAEQQKKSAQQSLTVNLQQLAQRVSQVVVAINQIGLRAVALNTDETLELFYNLYNPEAIEKKGMALSKAFENQ